MLELDVGELASVDLPDHLAPQATGLEHVGLVDAGHARPGGFEGRACDPFDLPARVHAVVGGAVFGARLRAEVDPAGQLAYHREVGVLYELTLEWAGVV